MEPMPERDCDVWESSRRGTWRWRVAMSSIGPNGPETQMDVRMYGGRPSKAAAKAAAKAAIPLVEAAWRALNPEAAA